MGPDASESRQSARVSRCAICVLLGAIVLAGGCTRRSIQVTSDPAGALVTKDVAPYTIVAGLPGTELRRRQPVDIAERLVALAWWDWSHDALRAALPEFRALSAEAFLEKYER